MPSGTGSCWRHRTIVDSALAPTHGPAGPEIRRPSVADVERIQAVAKRIAASKENGNDLVIVVSAMGHTTDELTGLALSLIHI